MKIAPEMDDLEWKPTTIPSGGSTLDALVCALEAGADWDEVLQRHKRKVIGHGGMLFQRLNKPELVPVLTPGAAGVGYKYPRPPAPELWYLPLCRFEEVLEATRYFGFPSGTSAKDLESTFADTKSLLADIHRRTRLSISQVDEAFILLDLASPGDRLSEADALRVMEFNHSRFGVRWPGRERRDVLRNWTSKGFFTVGGV